VLCWGQWVVRWLIWSIVQINNDVKDMIKMTFYYEVLSEYLD
jgi:hypothetical protein